MLLRAFRHRKTFKKVGQRLFRPLAYGVVTFLAGLIVWKFALGTLHMTGVLETTPGLRVQYIIPLAVGVGVLIWRLIRDLMVKTPSRLPSDQ